MKVSEATFKTCVFTLKVKTGLAPGFHDITDSVAKFVKQSELRNAFALVFSKHTTAAITTTINRLEIAKRYSAGIYGPLYVSKVLLFPDVITTTEGASAASTLATERPTWVA